MTTPSSTVELLRDVLTDFDDTRPRSQQVHIGPSEIGTPCQRQLAMKIAGVPRHLRDERPAWAPIQGTAIHELMEQALRQHNRRLGYERWLIEQRLVIHPGLPYLDRGITGRSDALDQDQAMEVDWKYSGRTTLRDVNRASVPNEDRVKPEYRVQAHLYGLGYERLGLDVKWVRIVFLARSHDFDESTEWTEPYRPDIAHEAITRYYATHDLLHVLNVAEHPELWGAVPAHVGDGCAWCPFRRPGPPDGTGCPGDSDVKMDKQLVGLIV